MRIGKKFSILEDNLVLSTEVSQEFGSRPVGIELELEGIHSYISEIFQKAKYWVPTQDNSLYYQGIELISQNVILSQNNGHIIPIAGIAVDKAFDELARLLLHYSKVVSKFNSTIKKTPRVSERTSNHVHIGVLDFDLDSLKNLYLNYIIFEPLLFSLIGGGRDQNIFCYPASKQAVVDNRLSAWPKEPVNGVSTTFGFFTSNFCKYEAFNMRSVAEKGTVEFRLNSGAYNHNAIKNWVKILLALVEYRGPYFWELWPSMNYARLLKYSKLVFKGLIKPDHSIAPKMYESYAGIKHHLVRDGLVDNETVLNKFLLRVVKESKKVPKCVE